MLSPKNVRNLILISILALVNSPKIFAHDEIDYPEDGQEFAPGDTLTIRWSNILVHDPIGWDLYFSSDAGKTFTPIVLGLPIDQFSYLWTIPDVLTDSAAIKVVQNNASVDYSDTHFIKIKDNPQNMITSIQDEGDSKFGIELNYPNPFSQSSTIQFRIPTDSQVTLEILDTQGRLVQTLLNREMKKGLHMETWNADDLRKGLYFIILESNDIYDTHRAIVR